MRQSVNWGSESASREEKFESRDRKIESLLLQSKFRWWGCYVGDGDWMVWVGRQMGRALVPADGETVDAVPSF